MIRCKCGDLVLYPGDECWSCRRYTLLDAADNFAKGLASVNPVPLYDENKASAGDGEF